MTQHTTCDDENCQHCCPHDDLGDRNVCKACGADLTDGLIMQAERARMEGR